MKLEDMKIWRKHFKIIMTQLKIQLISFAMIPQGERREYSEVYLDYLMIKLKQ